MQDPISIFNDFVRHICPLIAHEEMAKVAASLTVRELKKREYFIRAGERQKELGFIHKGLIRSFYVDSQGDEHTMRFMAELDFASNYAALLSNQPGKYDFQCLEDTTLVILPYDVVVNSYECSHQYERFGRIVAEKSCQMHQARIETFLFETAEQRYLNFITRYPSLFNRVSITHLCSYLGITRQSLTRIRNKIAKAGYNHSPK